MPPTQTDAEILSDEIDRHNRTIAENAELRRKLTASEDEACKGWAEADNLRLEMKTLQGRLHILQQDFEGRGDALTREINRNLDAQEDIEEMRPVVEAAVRWANEVRMFGGNATFTALKDIALAYGLAHHRQE